MVQMISLESGEYLWSVNGVEGSDLSKPFAVGVASDSDLLIVDEAGMVGIVGVNTTAKLVCKSIVGASPATHEQGGLCST